MESDGRFGNRMRISFGIASMFDFEGPSAIYLGFQFPNCFVESDGRFVSNMRIVFGIASMFDFVGPSAIC